MGRQVRRGGALEEVIVEVDLSFDQVGGRLAAGGNVRADDTNGRSAGERDRQQGVETLAGDDGGWRGGRELDRRRAGERG